ncbi:hypothetical protein [Brevibacillus borstelensis]|uniref:hypothetical protein n=1 Tax=Brevibacillus borstelensis TaxID=45462 RepID=UPI0012691AE8|nr:hypothetical protein [Brevibacillus borstelensis]MBE5395669.1 hypothetical protein [Brevibacillus borstelensis]MCC0565071.1 hypothetical protein [Brevibacillus borstelensis]MCM3471812.1 hypothetical protein [Brevibacillus borstelensis]MCM3561045.1 hypothetical protein [Brevibacillus borstelensis]MCM3592632.1 hypothetical protein [Brevibacillus borstelensis]
MSLKNAAGMQVDNLLFIVFNLDQCVVTKLCTAGVANICVDIPGFLRECMCLYAFEFNFPPRLINLMEVVVEWVLDGCLIERFTSIGSTA